MKTKKRLILACMGAIIMFSILSACFSIPRQLPPEVTAPPPRQVTERIAALSASGGEIPQRGMTFALMEDGNLWGWGDNNFFQLGDGTNERRYVPIRLMEDVIAVSSALGHTAVIMSDSSLWAWGGHRAVNRMNTIPLPK